MYLQFFGLNEKPFAITPDPRYLFLSERHAEALAHLVYGINQAGGFIQLTGEVGTGKTTTIRSLLAQVPKEAEVALVLNPRITAAEFLLTICEELGIGVPDESVRSIKDLVDILNAYLLRAHSRGQRVVLVVDEAHNLDPEVLEQLRLLTNLETETQKLLQIILIGQPELRELLDRNDLRQLAQRITGRYHLNPLSRDETAAYVRHRLRVAGSTSDIFSNGALAEMHRLAGGVPRLINVISDRALLGAYTQDRHQVSAALVRRAAQEVLGRNFAPVWLPWLTAAAAGAVVTAGALLLWQQYDARDGAARSTATGPSSGAGTNTAPQAASVAPPVAAAPSTTAPALVAANPPSPTLEQLLVTYAGETDPDNAFNKLFALWNARYLVGRTDACTQAAQQGLDCHVQHGTLADLHLYNRPAVLTLNDAAGAVHQVVLASLGDDRAVLSLGGTAREVRLGELSRLWFGDFVLLWHPATAGTRELTPGARGAGVRRLRADLQRARGVPDAPRGADVYDADLVRQVEEFQRQHRLNVDGIAGTQTLIVLDTSLASPDSPLLEPPARLAQGR
jgi:general secretion pathway protein A